MFDDNAAPKPSRETGDSGAFSADRSAALSRELTGSLDGEVRFDAGSRALYATDGSIYRQVPIGVVVPKSKEDVIKTVAACRAHGAPLLPRGGGTSLAGQCCNTAVVMDMSKYLNEVIDIDPKNKTARVQPGCVLDYLRDSAEPHHLTFGPDPATHAHNTLGGMIGNNSCGVHSVMAGRTADNVRRLEVLTYDGHRMWVGPTPEDKLDAIIREGGRRGEIYRRLRDLRDAHGEQIRARYPKIPRRVSGYNLDELLPEKGFNVARALVGSEGTCVTVLEAELDLVHSPPARNLLVLGYPDVYQAGDHVPEILSYGPVGLEGIDFDLIDFMKKKRMHPEDRELLPEGRGWLLVEFGGETLDEADNKARQLMAKLGNGSGAPNMKLFDDDEERKDIWEIRESGLGATAHVPGMRESHPGWEDAAVPPDRVGPYLRDFRKLLKQYDYGCALYGHFGDGCIHVRIDFDLVSEEGIRRWRHFMNDAADLVLSYDGSLSGEHGDGQVRAELLPKMFGSQLIDAFREFKSIWDPDWMMNPGKVIDADPMDANLRVGPGFHPPNLDTQFAYEVEGDFVHAANRCVGVGNCRNRTGKVMCPSYRGTLEEKYSTRGRARLLFEMLVGEPLVNGWKSDDVHDALDLCLACKGCKSDCPVNVDMATYKAEFNYHYYRGRMRPRAAYSMGMIDLWARFAARAPSLANIAFQAPGISSLAKTIGGIARQRRMPKFAKETFKRWFERRGRVNRGGDEVVLWPDTFNNYLHPEVLKATVEVLEAAGCRVIVPGPTLCCGRALYAEGMLDRAKKLLLATMEELGDGEAPIIGVEPACVAAFRDELIALFPNHARARSLSRRTVMLSEYLVKRDYRPPELEGKAIVHAHCNHHAVIGVGAEKEILSRLGLDFDFLDAGCCGMAGSFGFEAKKYDLSVKIAEHQLLPAIRKTDPDTLIITNGFSCREQITQLTDRRPFHLAEVLRMAVHARDRAGRTGRAFHGGQI
jgi:FAD/FMN-containing dehydrogenase/Fe-S oxidoreductase